MRSEHLKEEDDDKGEQKIEKKAINSAFKGDFVCEGGKGMHKRVRKGWVLEQ
jgi:hypothetical protein